MSKEFDKLHGSESEYYDFCLQELKDKQMWGQADYIESLRAELAAAQERVHGLEEQLRASLSSATNAEPIAQVVFWDGGSINVINGMDKLIALPVGTKIYATAPPNLSAAVAAVREQDIRVIESRANSDNNLHAPSCVDEIRGLQTEDGLEALQTFGMMVAKASSVKQYPIYLVKTGALDAELLNLVDCVMKGEWR